MKTGNLPLTFWSDALSSGGKTRSWGGVRFGTRLVDSRTAYKCPFQPPWPLLPSSGLEARTDGTLPLSCGKFEASSIFLLAVWGSAGAAGILMRWPLAMLWISGGSKALNRTAC